MSGVTEVRERLKAPFGQYRLVEIDRWSPPGEADTLLGDFGTIQEALQKRSVDTDDTFYMVYDDQGNAVEEEKVEKQNLSGDVLITDDQQQEEEQLDKSSFNMIRLNALLDRFARF